MDGSWGDWVEVGACSVTCGGGKQKRVRTCDNPKPLNGGKSCQGNDKDELECNTNACPAGTLFFIRSHFIRNLHPSLKNKTLLGHISFF